MIEIQPLNKTDIIDYLSCATMHSRERWASILDPSRPVAAVLISGLSTPLTTWLVCHAYRRASTDPRELLKISSELGEHGIRRHALGELIPAVYGVHNGRHRARSIREIQQIERRLARVADLIRRQRTYDLGWWRLGASMPWIKVRLTWLLLGAMLSLPMATLAFIMTDRVYAALAWLLSSMMGLTFSEAFMANVGDNLKTKLFAGLLIIWCSMWCGIYFGPNLKKTSPPRRLALRPQVREAIGSVIALVLIGLIFWKFGEPWLENLLDLDRGAFFKTQEWLVLLLFSCLVTAVLTGFSSDVDLDVNDPVTALREERRFAISSGLFGALMGGLAFALLGDDAIIVMLGFIDKEAAATYIGHVTMWPLTSVGLIIGFVIAITETVWWRFCASQCIFAFWGIAPLRLMAFLGEARDRGVLRQSGVSYQFRHSSLQDQLAHSRSTGWTRASLRDLLNLSRKIEKGTRHARPE